VDSTQTQGAEEGVYRQRWTAQSHGRPESSSSGACNWWRGRRWGAW